MVTNDTSKRGSVRITGIGQCPKGILFDKRGFEQILLVRNVSPLLLVFGTFNGEGHSMESTKVK